MSEIMECPFCNGKMTVTPNLYGTDVACPHCRQIMSIPGAAGRTAPAPLSPGPQSAAGRHSKTYQRITSQSAPPREMPAMPSSPNRHPQPNMGVIAGAAIVILGFFLPWIDLGPLGSIGGYEIPSKISSFASFVEKLADKKMPAEARTRVVVMKSLYALPFLAILAIWAQAAKHAKRKSWSCICSLGIIFILAVCLLLGVGPSSRDSGAAAEGIKSVFDFLAFGFYATIVGTVMMFGFSVIKEKE